MLACVIDVVSSRSADAFAHPEVPSSWSRVVERISDLYSNALASSTQRQYASHATYWARFCSLFGLTDCIFAPREEVICAFVAWLSFTNTASSIRSTMSGLRSFLSDHEINTPWSEWHNYRRVMKGLKRLAGGQPNRKRPISPTDLLRFHARMTHTPFSAALWACMLTTWWGMLRKSNTTVGYKNPLDAGSVIRSSDVEVVEHLWALRISIRKSKTNQFKERVHVIMLQGSHGHPLDPVAAWQRHLSVNAPTAAEAAFTFQEDGARLSISHEMLVKATKLLFAANGGKASEVSGHSYRRGGATFAFMAGVPDILIQHQGDWQSMAYRMYVDMNPEGMRRATQQMFDALRSNAHQTVEFPLADDPLGHTRA